MKLYHGINQGGRLCRPERSMMKTVNKKAYEENRNFHRYVDRYCKNRGISTEEALRHKLVSAAREYYEENEGKRVVKKSTYTPSGECK